MSENPTVKTVLGSDCVIRGEVTLDNDITVHGQVVGVLRAGGMLEVSASAKIDGTIITSAAQLAGEAQGNLIAEHGVQLLAGSTLRGRLFTGRLAVEEGATFEGEVSVGPNAMKDAAHVLQQLEQSGTQGANARTNEATSPMPMRENNEVSESSVVGNLLSQRRTATGAAAGNFRLAVDKTAQNAAG